MRKRQGLVVFARGPPKDSGSAPMDLCLFIRFVDELRTSSSS